MNKKYTPIYTLLLLLFLPVPAQSQLFLLDSTYRQALNPTTHQLQSFNKTIYDYNDSGKQTREEWSLLQGGNWVKSSSVLTYYGEDGALTEKISLFWDNILNNWKPSARFVYTYDGPYPEEEVQFTWQQQDLSWKKHIKTTTIRNLDSNSVETIFYYWHTASEIWVLSTKRLDRYDGDGNQIEQIYSTWDVGENDYVLYSKIEWTYSYSDTVDIKEENYFTWLASVNDWNPTTKRYYAHVEADSLAVETQYEWDSSTSSWDTVRLLQMAYDVHGNLRHVDISNWQGAWVLLDVIDHFWSEHEPVSGTEVGLPAYVIYPNPVEDFLFIDGLQEPARAAVYSTQGALMRSVVLQDADARINLRDLPGGVYFLHLKAGRTNILKQLVRK